MSTVKNNITVSGTKLGETAKAVKFQVFAVNNAELIKPQFHWFPFSQISKMGTDAREVGRDYLVVSEWLLKEKSLLDVDTINEKYKEAEDFSDRDETLSELGEDDVLF